MSRHFNKYNKRRKENKTDTKVKDERQVSENKDVKKIIDLNIFDPYLSYRFEESGKNGTNK